MQQPVRQPLCRRCRRWRKQSVQMGRKICVCLSICELANAAQMRQIASQTAGPLQRGGAHGAAEARDAASTRKSSSMLGTTTLTRVPSSFGNQYRLVANCRERAVDYWIILTYFVSCESVWQTEYEKTESNDCLKRG